MAENSNRVKEVSKFISKDFTIGNDESLIPSGNYKTLEEFKFYLTQKIAYLMDNKYDTLINTLYRIDVSEEKLAGLFSGENREYIPAVIAELIIERSLQKVRFREKYKRGEI